MEGVCIMQYGDDKRTQILIGNPEDKTTHEDLNHACENVLKRISLEQYVKIRQRHSSSG
jgi:DNA gyrase/topoisomerase IV subunit A